MDNKIRVVQYGLGPIGNKITQYLLERDSIQIVSFGINIVSTCEELSHPWLTNPEIADEIDVAAKMSDVSVLATGINPGFLMDFLPLAMTGICRNVKKIMLCL